MLNSDAEGASLRAARQVSRESLRDEKLLPLAQELQTGTRAQRLAAAQVYAYNLSNASYRKASEHLLSSFFEDDDPEIRAAAAEWPRWLNESKLSEFEGLARDFVDSRALEQGHEHLLSLIERSTSLPENVAMETVEVFLTLAGDKIGGFETRESAEAQDVKTIALRTVQHASTDEIRSRALDVIDHLVERGVWGLEGLFKEFDRE
jgi:hypothetical protein